jgi:dolichol-phosphate mannosyltransferase
MPTAIIIPAHNERATLARVVARIECPGEWRAFVVDDGSTDGGASTVESLAEVEVIRHERPRGYGAALLSGFSVAAARGFGTVVTLDADLQHEPETVAVLVRRLDGADIVTGTRWHAESELKCEPPAQRREMNRRVLGLINGVTNYNLTDAMCGFRAYTADALRRLALTEEGYGINFEIWVKAARLGLRVVEVPVPVIYPEVAKPIGGGLDDPEVRYRYYEEVVSREVGR